jgi:hypothetical protein
MEAQGEGDPRRRAGRAMRNQSSAHVRALIHTRHTGAPFPPNRTIRTNFRHHLKPREPRVGQTTAKRPGRGGKTQQHLEAQQQQQQQQAQLLAGAMLPPLAPGQMPYYMYPNTAAAGPGGAPYAPLTDQQMALMQQQQQQLQFVRQWQYEQAVQQQHQHHQYHTQQGVETSHTQQQHAVEEGAEDGADVTDGDDPRHPHGEESNMYAANAASNESLNEAGDAAALSDA